MYTSSGPPPPSHGAPEGNDNASGNAGGGRAYVEHQRCTTRRVERSTHGVCPPRWREESAC